MQVKGILKKKYDTTTVGNGIAKREFISSVTSGSYTDDICIQLMKDKVNLIDNFNEGREITVDFNLKSNEHAGKWCTNYTAFRIS